MARKGDPLGYYERLGVQPTATADDIRRAFKERAKELHPDSNQSGPDDAFQAMAEAYETLKHPQRRLEYDALAAREDEKWRDGAVGGERRRARSEQGAAKSQRSSSSSSGERRRRSSSGSSSSSGHRRHGQTPSPRRSMGKAGAALLIGGLAASTVAALGGVWVLREEVQYREQRIIELTARANEALDEAEREAVRRRLTQYRETSQAARAAAGEPVSAIYEAAIDFGPDGVALAGPLEHRFHEVRADIEAAIEAMPREAEWKVALEVLAERPADGDAEASYEDARKRLLALDGAFASVGFAPENLAHRIAFGFAADQEAAQRIGLVEVRLLCCFDGAASLELARYRAESIVEQRAQRARQAGEAGGPGGVLEGVVPAIFPPDLFESGDIWPGADGLADRAAGG